MIIYQYITKCLLLASGFLIASHAYPKKPDMDNLDVILEHQAEIAKIVLSVSTSCVAGAISNPQQMELVKKELAEIAKGVAAVAAEEITALIMKKDYPNICHVMPERFFADIDENTTRGSECITRLMGKCVARAKTETPEYSYYWPKYFIEVSEKGNDIHPSFGKDNEFYKANRKIANQLSDFLDVKGPANIVNEVSQLATSIEKMTGAFMGQGFDITPSKQDIENLVKTEVLTPFEKLRIRANKKPDMPSYEVNIWPVALSTTMAEKLTVCEKGGFQWPLKGVAMTCPVAMSKDAWPYWDSGLLDYLNPSAIRGIVSASDPKTCIADNLSSSAFDSLGAQKWDPPLGGDPGKDLDNIPDNLRGIGLCSLPITGTAEAILSQSLQTLNDFKGPWCTMWGPIVPRHSTHVHTNAFGFANAALKFKLLAHNLFGIPRGNAERWALAYPWEDNHDFLSKQKDWIKGFLSKLSIPEDKINSFLKISSFGRSTTLMIPGDPRMMDEFNPNDLAKDHENLEKEILYTLSLNKATSEMSDQIQKTFSEKNNQEESFSEKLQREERERLRKTKKITISPDKEAIYQKRHYCYVWSEKQGAITRGDVIVNIPDFGPGYFVRISDPSLCHKERQGSCIDRHPLTGNCIKPESIYYYQLTRQEVVGYRSVKNPNLTKVSGPFSVESRDTQTRNTHHRFHTIEEKIVPIGPEESGEDTDEPDLKDPEKTIDPQKKNPKAAEIVNEAAKIAPWIASEIARAKYEDLSGTSLLPGKKRIFTIFEKIHCRPKKIDGGELKKSEFMSTGIFYWNDCTAAVRYEIRKYVQRRLLRPICDKILNHQVGEPFKK